MHNVEDVPHFPSRPVYPSGVPAKCTKGIGVECDLQHKCSNVETRTLCVTHLYQPTAGAFVTEELDASGSTGLSGRIIRGTKAILALR